MAQVVPADGGRPARLSKSLKWRLTIGSRKYIGAPELLPSQGPRPTSTSARIRSAFSYRLGASAQQLSRHEPGTREQGQNSDRYHGDQGHTAGARELSANNCRSGATTGSVAMALRSGGHDRS
jgi:hypothetical protein